MFFADDKKTAVSSIGRLLMPENNKFKFGRWNMRVANEVWL